MSADTGPLPRPAGRRSSPRARRLARTIGLLFAATLVAAVGAAWWSSLRPATYSAMAMGVTDPGGGPVVVGRTGDHGAHGPGAASAVAVTTLVADPDRSADVRIELAARAERVTLPGGEQLDAFTLNGTTPGPEIRARQGELVEVVLRNESVARGTTLHWHGVDVPAAMDGVAGVTQDAVMPGGTFTYRFVAEEAGSYWYHAHQVSHAQVVGGLFGVLVVEPSAPTVEHDVDVAIALHSYPGTSRTIGGASGDVVAEALEGDLARVRVVNTDNAPTVVWVTGAPFRVRSVDGTDVHEPSEVEALKVAITAGGRIDLELRVPASGARVQAPGVSLALGGADAPAAAAPATSLDLLEYGTPAPLGFDPSSADRSFAYDIGRLPGFLHGMPGIWWTINGRMGDDVPAYHVSEGDVVTMRITNGSGEVHPMHLHGHHVVVLARNGEPATGSPWWVDSLDVGHGETFDIAFVADNPGIWMDHCHTLPHAVEGLVTHPMYEGVTTPFLLGAGSGNEPE